MSNIIHYLFILITFNIVSVIQSNTVYDTITPKLCKKTYYLWQPTWNLGIHNDEISSGVVVYNIKNNTKDSLSYYLGDKNVYIILPHGNTVNNLYKFIGTGIMKRLDFNVNDSEDMYIKVLYNGLECLYMDMKKPATVIAKNRYDKIATSIPMRTDKYSYTRVDDHDVRAQVGQVSNHYISYVGIPNKIDYKPRMLITCRGSTNGGITPNKNIFFHYYIYRDGILESVKIDPSTNNVVNATLDISVRYRQFLQSREEELFYVMCQNRYTVTNIPRRVKELEMFTKELLQSNRQNEYKTFPEVVLYPGVITDRDSGLLYDSVGVLVPFIKNIPGLVIENDSHDAETGVEDPTSEEKGVVTDPSDVDKSTIITDSSNEPSNTTSSVESSSEDVDQ